MIVNDIGTKNITYVDNKSVLKNVCVEKTKNISNNKVDTVELNSGFTDDYITIYEKLCSEFPDVNFILSDLNGSGNMFFNGINSQIGDDFGGLNSKSIFIDSSVIKKYKKMQNIIRKQRVLFKL